MSVFTRNALVSSLALGLAALGQGWMLRQNWPGFLPGLFFVALWCALTASAQPLWSRLHVSVDTPPPNRLRRLLFPAAALLHAALAFLIARSAVRLLLAPPTVTTTPVFDSRVHLVGLSLLVVLFFLRHFLDTASAGPRRDPTPALHLVLGLLALQSVVGLLAPFFPAAPLALYVNRGTAAIALYLPLEWCGALAFRAFQSPRRRQLAPFSGLSLASSALLGGRSPFATFAAALQESLGLELRGSWLASWLKLYLEPLLLLLLLALWLSSSLVVVPLGSEAVRVRWGHFQPVPLGPGLHFIAPWPMERTRLVPVARVDTFALGYDKDLGGAMLWAEPHFSGERNLLVGNGEQSLTFNVPVQFSRPDALAIERAGPALSALLSNLAFRELLLATAPREGFAIMTTERETIAREVQAGLQTAADRFRLGARIHHVGLKDIHPAVEVAPAFQEVISAREQRRMMVDLAQANRITSLAEARSEAHRLRRQADGATTERLAAVAGEAARLTGKVDARRASPDLFDLQSRLSLTEEIVPRVRLFLTRGDESSPAPLTLDYREGSASYP